MVDEKKTLMEMYVLARTNLLSLLADSLEVRDSGVTVDSLSGTLQSIAAASTQLHNVNDDQMETIIRATLKEISTTEGGAHLPKLGNLLLRLSTVVGNGYPEVNN